MEKVFTYETAAEYLGVSQKTVWNYVNKYKWLEASKFGNGNVRITEKALMKFIANFKKVFKKKDE